MLFGRSRRQAAPMSTTPDMDTVESAWSGHSHIHTHSSKVEVSEAGASSEEQFHQHDEGMQSQASVWQDRYPNTSDDLSPNPVTASPGSAAFATPSSALLTSPDAAMSHADRPDEAGEEAVIDPLSHRFEERTFTARHEPSLVNVHEVESQPVYAQHLKPWGSDRGVDSEGDRGGVSSEHRSRTASPSLGDHGSFDPLTATFEEFEAFNRSQEQRSHPPEQLPAQLPNQSPAMTNLQLPQQPQPPPIAVTSTEPRKTRSIPRIFRLRKTGSATESPSSFGGNATPPGSHTTEADTAAESLSTGGVDPTPAEDTPQGPPHSLNADLPPAVPKPRSKTFGLLRKRSKGTATSQQPPDPSEAPPQTSNPLPGDGAGQASQQGLLGDSLRQFPLVEGTAGDVHHVNTVLALSAGLTGTFGSFMAASSPSASPRGPPESPHHPPHGSQDALQALPDQVSAALVACIALYISICKTKQCHAWCPSQNYCQSILYLVQ